MKFLVLLILLCSSNNYSVELILKDGPLGSGQIYIPCTIDFILYECFFDSGAKESLVSLNEFERYKKIGEYNMGGAAGVGKKYDEIVVKDVRLGEFSKLNYKVGRSQDDFTQKLMIGSSFFIDQSLFFNFKENEITPHVLLNSELDVYPLKTFGGRPLVDVNVGGSKLNGVWDTGAGLTTVD